MGREDRARPVDLVQMLDRRPGDGKSVERRRSASDFIENDKRPSRRAIQDRRRLHHLDHEGRTPAREIVRGADA